MTLSKQIPGLAKRITQYLTWDDHGPGEHSDNVGADAWELMEEAAALIQRQAEEIAELKRGEPWAVEMLVLLRAGLADRYGEGMLYDMEAAIDEAIHALSPRAADLPAPSTGGK